MQNVCLLAWKANCNRQDRMIINHGRIRMETEYSRLRQQISGRLVVDDQRTPELPEGGR